MNAFLRIALPCAFVFAVAFFCGKRTGPTDAATPIGFATPTRQLNSASLVALPQNSAASEDFTASLAAAKKLGFGRIHRLKLRGIFEAWSKQSVRESLAAALLLHGDDRNEAVAIIFKEWCKTSPLDACSWLVENQSRLSGDNPVEDSFKALARSTTAETIAGLLLRLNPAFRAEALGGAIIEVYRRQGGSVAFELIRNSGDDRSRGEGVRYFVKNIAEDGISSFQVFDTIPSDLLDESVISVFASHLAEQSPEATASWALGLKEPFREAALKSALFIWAEKGDPLAAGSWLLANARDNPNVLLSVMAPIARVDPELAINLASTAKGQIGQDSLTTVLNIWGESDPVSAQNWVLAQPIDERSKFMAISLVGGVAKRDPLAAYALAISMSDPTMREWGLTGLATEWSRKDPAGMEEFLASNSQMPAEVRKLLNWSLHPK